MEGTETGDGLENVGKNHPSAYGGYAPSRPYCCSSIEPSLHIRRVLLFPLIHPLQGRTVPPHTEGTLSKINVFRWLIGNVCQYTTLWANPTCHASFLLPSLICLILGGRKKEFIKNMSNSHPQREYHKRTPLLRGSRIV